MRRNETWTHVNHIGHNFDELVFEDNDMAIA